MSIRTSRWPAGVPCWVDLTVPDVAAAKAFYGAVVGWTFQDTEAEYGGDVIPPANGGAGAGAGPPQTARPGAGGRGFSRGDAHAPPRPLPEGGGAGPRPPRA